MPGLGREQTPLEEGRGKYSKRGEFDTSDWSEKSGEVMHLLQTMTLSERVSAALYSPLRLIAWLLR